MTSLIKRYTRWLHTQWPAGIVEKLPQAGEDGSTNIPGIYITGDLTGVPLLKFALESGARTVSGLAKGLRQGSRETLDLVIVGAGVSGLAAAVEAKKRGLTFQVLEAAEPFSTLVNFPKQKPIYTYPREMDPYGDLKVTADVKEALLEELQRQIAAHGIEVTQARVQKVSGSLDAFVVEGGQGKSWQARRVLIAIGRSGDFRKLGVPGENLPKVTNRLHDPKDFTGQDVLVVGGGDSALETTVALVRAGAGVTLSYRKRTFSRAKQDNIEAIQNLGTTSPGKLQLLMESTVQTIQEEEVVLRTATEERTVRNDAVFLMIGREAPLSFFRRSGIRIMQEMSSKSWASMGLFMLFCVWLYNWKSGGAVAHLWVERGWFPTTLAQGIEVSRGLWDILRISASGPAFWYTLAYSLVVVVFGIRRIRRRRTPYVTVQTATLMLIQVIPLFLLPEIILPLLDHVGWLPRAPADALFPVVNYGHGREFWRAYGLILAWPLNVYNVMTPEPLPVWLGIAFVQTFVLIPTGIYFAGKGLYCGWICSCGALAETLGDTHRHKMPHGPRWNRLNMLGQGILALATLLLLLRISAWIWPQVGWLHAASLTSLAGYETKTIFRWINYKWVVDVFLAGVLGYGMYFWFSGRTWCRFACPLAALMHIFARFSTFRILAEKKKCISCNVCTSVCHQGIDVMNFANKGLPMKDPECVRCSACVQSCPTGVLRFGRVDGRGSVISTDRLQASPVQMKESGTDG